MDDEIDWSSICRKQITQLDAIFSLELTDLSSEESSTDDQGICKFRFVQDVKALNSQTI